MSCIGYLVSFATGLFGLLVGRYWKLLDYRNIKDRDLILEILEILPEDQMLSLSNITESDQFAEAPFLFLAAFIRYCQLPHVEFYNYCLERHKNNLVDLISELDFVDSIHLRPYDDSGFRNWSVSDNEEPIHLLTSFDLIYTEYKKLIRKSRKL